MMAIWYMTKYALSGGIQVVEGVAESPAFMEGKSWVKAPNGYQHYYVGKDIFAKRDEAIRDAEKRRNAKIASLEKQKRKLLATDFTAQVSA